MAPLRRSIWVSVSISAASLLLLLTGLAFWTDHETSRGYLLVSSTVSTLVAQGGVFVAKRNACKLCSEANNTVTSNLTCTWSQREWTQERLDGCPHVKALLHTWNNSRYFEGNYNPAPNLLDWPQPPHLADCDRTSQKQRSQDSRLSDGGLPHWAKDELAPNPPWVRGTDADNAPLTRVVQRDLWVQQHPTDCNASDVRFLVAQWIDTSTHGLGSQLHIMTAGLALAVMTRRVFVLEDKFERAMHEGCMGESKGKLDCYVLPATSSECAAIALAAKQHGVGSVDEAQDSKERVIYLPEYVSTTRPVIDLLPNVWGEPWKTRPGSIEFKGKLVDETLGPYNSTERLFGPMNWWRAQASRYLLRAPSAYLCKVMNRARHDAFGIEVGAQVVQSMRFQKEHAPSELGFRQYGELEEVLWQEEVYMPRPVISVHVRHGWDKSGEMNIVDLPDYMEQAERLRLHNPAVQSVWLSTEARDVLEQALTVYEPHWRVYYTSAERILSNESDPWNTHTPSREGSDLAFANLFIAADADYFIGVLGSNWNRLIDELRKTGGKLKAGYIALNYDQTR